MSLLSGLESRTGSSIASSFVAASENERLPLRFQQAQARQNSTGIGNFIMDRIVRIRPLAPRGAVAANFLNAVQSRDLLDEIYFALEITRKVGIR